MAFPATRLPVKVELALGANLTANPATWVWTDVTAYVRYADRISYTAGKPNEGSQTQPANCRLRFDNRDGRFTTRNPLGAYYSLLRKNTPMRVRVDGGGGYVTRFSGYVAAWPARWNKRANDSTVPVEAYGILARLGQGKVLTQSALRRTLVATSPAAYWPVEDGAASGQAASGIPGLPALTVSGPVTFRAVEDYVDLGYTVRFGTSALADLSAGGSLSAKSLPPSVTSVTSGQWTVHVAAGLMDPATLSGNVTLLEWTTPGGSFVRWKLVAQKSPTRLQVYAYNAAGTETLISEYIGLLTGFAHYGVSAYQSGANIKVDFYPSSNEPDPFSSYTGAGTLAGITSIVVNPTGATATTQMPFGHVAIFPASAPLFNFAGALDSEGRLVNAAWASFDNEKAVNRLVRLAAGDGIILDVLSASLPDAQRMGPQPSDTSLNLYAQTEDADQGILYESGFGLGYIARDHRYNPAVSMALDFDLGHIADPPEPTDDDQQLRNRWTVSRTDGSSAVAQDADSISDVGLYDASISVNHATDDELSDHASWRVHLGTVEEMRWPKIRLNLARSPGLITQWLLCGIGSRITIANAPDQVLGETIDLIIEGYSETFGPNEWTVDLNCSPARPWLVAEVAGAQRVDSESSVLASGISSSATSLSVSSAAVDVWTTDATEMPVDILVGGERMRIDAAGQVLNSNAWMTNGVTGWVGNNATIAPVATPSYQGYPSAAITAAGGASGGLSATRVAVTAGTTYTASIWAYCSSSVIVGPAIDWQISSGAYLSTSIMSPTTIPANTWTLISAQAVAPATAAQAEVRARHDATTPAATVWYTTGVRLIPSNTISGTSPQPFTVTRAVNGVVKAHSAGAEVHVANPAVVSL